MSENIIFDCGNQNADGFGSGGGIALEGEPAHPGKHYNNKCIANTITNVTGKGILITQDNPMITDVFIDRVSNASGDNSVFTGLGIYGISSKGIRIINTKIIDAQHRAMYLIGTTSGHYIEAYIESMTASGSDYGVILKGVSDVTIDGGTFTQDVGAEAISIDNTNTAYNQGNGTAVVRNALVKGSTAFQGIKSKHTEFSDISGNVVLTNNGIKVLSTARATVRSNFVDDTTGGIGITIEATVQEAYEGNNDVRSATKIVNDAGSQASRMGNIYFTEGSGAPTAGSMPANYLFHDTATNKLYLQTDTGLLESAAWTFTLN